MQINFHKKRVFFSPPFFPVCLWFIAAEFSKKEGEVRVSLFKLFKTLWLLLLLQIKQFFKGILHWRSTELRTDIEITHPVLLNVSLKLFSTKKKKQCFMFIPPALRYLVGVLSEKKIIYEVNSHASVEIHLGVFVNVLNFFSKENLPSFT